MRFPLSGRFTPLAAKSKSDRSCMEGIFPENDFVEALLENAFITQSPLSIFGGASFVISPPWEIEENTIIIINKNLIV